MMDRTAATMKIELVLKRPRFKNADEAIRTLLRERRLLVAMESSSACSKRIASGR